MVPGQSHHQEARQLRPDQSMQPIGHLRSRGVEGCAMRDQQAWTPGANAVLNCHAHALTIV